MGLSIFDETYPYNLAAEILPANTTTLVPIIGGQQAAVRIDAILLASNAAAAHVVELLLTGGTVDGLVGSISIPAGSGYAAAPVVDLVPTIVPLSIGGLLLPANYGFGLRLAVTLGAGETITVTVIGGFV